MSETAKGPVFIFCDKPGVVAWPAKISVPLSGGTREDQLLMVRYKVVSEERINELLGTPMSRAFPVEGNPPQGDVALLREVIEGFNDLRDESGQTVDDAVAKDLLLSLPYAVPGLAFGFFEMLGRRVEKN